jgi:hypothetical protein
MSESIQYWATTNSGNANSDPAISSSDSQAPNTVATNIRSIMTAVAKARLDVLGGLTAGGTANALTVTTNQVLISAQLTGGLAIMLKAASTNTNASVTFAPDGLTAAPIKRADGSALAVGSIQVGMFLLLVYNSGTSEWWASNIPPATTGAAKASFSARKTTNQSISSATATTVTFDTVDFDVGSHFSGSANWTPPAGTVIMSASVFVNGTGGLVTCLAIYKNGVILKSGPEEFSTGAPQGADISFIDQCNGTDVYSVVVYCGGTSPAVTANSVFGAGACFFTGSML